MDNTMLEAIMHVKCFGVTTIYCFVFLSHANSPECASCRLYNNYCLLYWHCSKV